jgi:ketosteroid isomerase-like protein
MNAARPLGFALLLCALAGAPASARDRDASGQVEASVDALLAAYAADHPDEVLAMLDPHGFVIYGSDVDEVVRTPEQLRQLMADDFALWKTASFGAPANLDIHVEGTLASAFFDVPFSAGGAPPVTVRFATAWHRDGDRWLLVQGANVVPTTGSSAHALANGLAH